MLFLLQSRNRKMFHQKDWKHLEQKLEDLLNSQDQDNIPIFIFTYSMPTKYRNQRLRKVRRSRKSRKSRKIRGGALSARTNQLLLNQYNGLSGMERRRPTIVELNQFMIDNQIEEPLYVVMDNIVNLLGRLLSRPTDEEREESDRLAALVNEQRTEASNRS